MFFRKKDKNKFRFIEVDKKYFKVLNHWFWDEYDKTGWEPETYKTFKKFISLDSTYVDIGAWVGCTLFFATNFNPQKLFAVEANSKSYRLLVDNCKMNKATKNTNVSNVCIYNKNNELVNFGSTNKNQTSSASSIRGNDFQVQTKTLYTYLEENRLLQDKLFIKIDIEGAEELIINDLIELSTNKDLTVYLSVHPPFYKNKEKMCNNILNMYKYFKTILDSNCQPLPEERLKDMILTSIEFPNWGTQYGNFFEITMTNGDVSIC